MRSSAYNTKFDIGDLRRYKDSKFGRFMRAVELFPFRESRYLGGLMILAFAYAKEESGDEDPYETECRAERIDNGGSSVKFKVKLHGNCYMFTLLSRLDDMHQKHSVIEYIKDAYICLKDCDVSGHIIVDDTNPYAEECITAV